MKKLLTVLLALVLALPALSFAAGSIVFGTGALDEYNWDADGWTDNETGAAAFIDLCILSLCRTGRYTPDDFDLSCGAYVWKSGSAVAGGVALSTGKGIDFFYIPSSDGYGTYVKSSSVYSESTLKNLVKSMAENGSAENPRYVSPEKLLEVRGLIPAE